MPFQQEIKRMLANTNTFLLTKLKRMNRLSTQCLQSLEKINKKIFRKCFKNKNFIFLNQNEK
ncbi:unnamed protein product [Meloidogyne enterolobii]|uniref:Uncharacterized protein n=1 Tax=Meloidogyne enterolobii TaxID=390850 RepID=A0ACB0Z6G7_MELEN